MLFVCTHNSARSQMAEGIMRGRHGDRFDVASAGTEPTFVHPLAIEAMREIGIDISEHRSKHVSVFLGQTFDYVVTVCDHAKGTCPFFPGAKEYIHASFPDPSDASTEDTRRSEFRRVRDRLLDWIDQTFGQSGNEDSGNACQ